MQDLTLLFLSLKKLIGCMLICFCFLGISLSVISMLSSSIAWWRSTKSSSPINTWFLRLCQTVYNRVRSCILQQLYLLSNNVLQTLWLFQPLYTDHLNKHVPWLTYYHHGICLKTLIGWIFFFGRCDQKSQTDVTNQIGKIRPNMKKP